jgi:CubicO group peptidase (beta-lactamase class C family)
MKKYALFFTILMTVHLFSCAKKNVGSVSTVEDLDTNFKQLSKNMLMAGFAVTVVKKDKILYQNAFGQADVAKNTPYTSQTLQPIASISKTFIGVALMKAIEQGHFTLETPINDVLPFKIKNPNAPNSIIRIKHLAVHTSGLTDNETTYFKNHSILAGENTTSVEAKRMVNELGFGTNGTVLLLKDFLEAYYTERGRFYNKINFAATEAGAAYSYSNIGAALAAYLIEVKTGKTFPDYCADNIFKPLGMANTSWFLTADNRPKMATLHWERNKPLPFYATATYPDGGLITSNEDLSKYFIEMIKGYSGESTFLKKESFDLLFKKQFEIGKTPVNLNVKEENAGVFWVYFKNGRLGHTGGDFGVATIMAFYPETKTGFIFMTNSETEYIDNYDPIKKQMNTIFEDIKSFEKNN